MVACVVGNTHFAPPPCLVKWWPLGIFLIFIIIVVIVKLIITIPTIFSTKYTQQLGSSRLSRPLDPSGDFVLRSLQPLRPRDSSHTRVPGCQHPFICLIGWSFASQLSSNIFNTENQSHWLVTKDSSHNQLPCPYCFSSLFICIAVIVIAIVLVFAIVFVFALPA